MKGIYDLLKDTSKDTEPLDTLPVEPPKWMNTFCESLSQTPRKGSRAWFRGHWYEFDGERWNEYELDTHEEDDE